ncbi:hypothetical protein [Botrimarina hoheduenensis]|uniref:Uncharacterized protein n=1 Tax=Botrimarina hoheduenensis TaxID=2528000 RepID=A0A5C5WE15_9BACT|nr:hypothetical protein [Botrimarina hoheduenensis]TWT48840.1 hypothetical protein Pla111_06160 [Botrimarina hoheduenensis]
MRIFCLLTALTVLTSLAGAASPTALGPAPAIGLSQGTAAMQAYRRGTPPRNAMEYYGVVQAAAQGPAGVPSSRVTRSTTGNSAVGGAMGNKPFVDASSTPTLSPYLNLYREDGGQAAPNYHTFVLPQQQQNELNRQQSLQLQQLRRQVRQTQYTSPAVSGASGSFNNTGRYYQQWR